MEISPSRRRNISTTSWRYLKRGPILTKNRQKKATIISNHRPMPQVPVLWQNGLWHPEASVVGVVGPIAGLCFTCRSATFAPGIQRFFVFETYKNCITTDLWNFIGVIYACFRLRAASYDIAEKIKNLRQKPQGCHYASNVQRCCNCDSKRRQQRRNKQREGCHKNSFNFFNHRFFSKYHSISFLDYQKGLGSLNSIDIVSEQLPITVQRYNVFLK